jgi:hypothetical protein
MKCTRTQTALTHTYVQNTCAPVPPLVVAFNRTIRHEAILLLVSVTARDAAVTGSVLDAALAMLEAVPAGLYACARACTCACVHV